MNKVFDYQGTFVSTSTPKKQLRTVKKTLLIDSADRDTTKYFTNGDVVYYLPRVYENVVSIRLKSATFPRLLSETSSPGALTHSYTGGQNTSNAFANATDTAIAAPVPHYFLLEIEGLNKTDETTVSAQRSSYVDNFFAKIPTTLAQNTSTGYYIDYNDHTEEENIVKFYPAIGKLDRLHVTTRLHSQQDASGFLYWTADGSKTAGKEKASGSDYSLVFEIEMLDNGFDDFSSLETRINNREVGNYGC